MVRTELQACAAPTSPCRMVLGCLLLYLGGLGISTTAQGEREHPLLGRYETALPKEGSHMGQVTHHPTLANRFRWSDDDGASWDLKPDIASGLLVAAEEGKPDIQLQFDGRPGESAVRTLRIEGRLYFRKPVPGKERDSAPAREAPSEPSKPGKVKKVGQHTYQVGQIAFDKLSREIVFDARVNQVGGPIEYLLVNERGKTHEALFSCDIRPVNLNIAFLLLGYTPSAELFQIRAADHRPTGGFPTVSESVRSQARLRIAVTWTSGGRIQTAEVNEFIVNEETGKPMASGPWLYTGSVITETGYRAEQTGDIMAVFADAGAMVNHPGEARNRDDIWSVKQGTLPAKGSQVRISIQPNSRRKPSSAD